MTPAPHVQVPRDYCRFLIESLVELEEAHLTAWTHRKFATIREQLAKYCNQPVEGRACLSGEGGSDPHAGPKVRNCWTCPHCGSPGGTMIDRDIGGRNVYRCLACGRVVQDDEDDDRTRPVSGREGK